MKILNSWKECKGWKGPRGKQRQSEKTETEEIMLLSSVEGTSEEISVTTPLTVIKMAISLISFLLCMHECIHPFFLPSLLSIPLPHFSLFPPPSSTFPFFDAFFEVQILHGRYFFKQRKEHHFLNQEIILDSVYNQVWLIVLVPNWPLLLLACSKQRKPYQKRTRRPEGFNFCCS